MVCTIGAIIAYQLAWLRKSYTEEKAVFMARTNFLLRETVFMLQTARLRTDTVTETYFDNKSRGVIVTTNVLKNKVQTDSSDLLRRAGSIHLDLQRVTSRKKSDTGVDADDRVIKDRVFYFLDGTDGGQGAITGKEIAAQYQKGLDSIGVHLPFRIVSVAKKLSPRIRDTAGSVSFLKRMAIKLKPPMMVSDTDSSANMVTVGFPRPETYRLEFDDLPWYLVRRISVQALFSLLLIALTTGSFLMLYRNWRKQQRLTELKNDFIGNMTHELKTPIATVSVAVEALRHFNALQDPVRTQEYLEISAGELQRLSLMVDKVLKLSLFETKGIELKNESFDLRTLAEEVMASMRLQFEKYRARLSMEIEGSDFSLRADKLHITSVIFNLLDNALKYSRQDPSIRVGVAGEPEQVVLSVTDNGMGIPSAYIGRVFEKFFRVPTGDQHNVKGYGLGLSYVSYVLQRHGGRISVESEEGVGSCFTIKIPREQG